MPIPISGSVAPEVPDGLQTEFAVVGAEFDENNRYGPRIELDLELTDERYLGTAMKYWANLARPRIDKVRRLREAGLDDEDIEKALRKQGYQFKNIDDPDVITVARGGNLYKILTAAEGSVKGAESALKECEGYDELAKRLVGASFVGTVKLSEDGKYAQLDGKEEIYPVARRVLASESPKKGKDEVPPESEGDFEDLQF